MGITDSSALRWKGIGEDLRLNGDSTDPEAQGVPQAVKALVEQIGHAFGNVTGSSSVSSATPVPGVEYIGRTLQYASRSALLLGEFIQSAVITRGTPQQEAIRRIETLTGAGISDARLAEFFGVTRPALHSWKRGGRISPSHLQRVLAVCEVFERATVTYDTPEALLGWLERPSGPSAVSPAQALKAGDIDRARYLAVVTESDRNFVQPEVRQRYSKSRGAGSSEHDWNRLPPESDVTMRDLFGRTKSKIDR